MSNIPIKKETFDYILSFSALMNSDNVERTMNEIKRILKKDGKIIISYLKKFDFLELIKNNFKILKQETIDEDVLFILEQKV
jgi:ubiquinone/menaquinone biosynthesis C-methylase UbiE